MKPILFIFTVFSALILMACDGGASDTDTDRGNYNKGKLTLSITDAAVDDIAEVWIQFSKVELNPDNSDEIVTVKFDQPLDIDLLTLQGNLSQDLFNGLEVPSGSYSWMRLSVNVDSDMDSYVILKDGNVHELVIPSGSQTGLKINTPFTVGTMSSSSFTLDFDLRRSIVIADGKYLLKPTMRLVNNAEAGSIGGSITAAMTVGPDCSDDQPETGNAVYVFEGIDAAFDDIDNQDPEPITTALVSLNTATGDYDYEVGFLPTGDYTVAFTCMADQDNPETDEVIEFTSLGNITIDMPEETGGAEFNR